MSSSVLNVSAVYARRHPGCSAHGEVKFHAALLNNEYLVTPLLPAMFTDGQVCLVFKTLSV